VHVRAEIVDPEFLRCSLLRCWLAVEEEDICLDALRVEQAGRQAKERMYVALVQEFSPDRLPCSAFEQDIVRNNDCPAVLFEQGLDMLKEV
jgi:hypothetical protein